MKTLGRGTVDPLLIWLTSRQTMLETSPSDHTGAVVDEKTHSLNVDAICLWDHTCELSHTSLRALSFIIINHGWRNSKYQNAGNELPFVLLE